MDKNIIIAGAGHGGLVCAAILAERGFNVTVYEKKNMQTIGLDQTDSFMINCFDAAGIPRPSDEFRHPSEPQCFTNPAQTVKIRLHQSADGNCVMDRKYLIRYLIGYAKDKGVRFCFDTEIICPVTDSNRILGIVTKKSNRLTTVTADLIIDNAGVDSPLRSLLPQCFGITNSFSDDSIFTCYRAFHKKSSPDFPEDKYMVYFFHRKNPGISWIISKNEYFDVLIGKFGTKLSETDIETALSDMQKNTPEMSEEIIRGGQIYRIPLRKAIPLMVADGYAAIGDCAAMTIPIIGSGIANSIIAGRYLADAITDDTEMLFTKEKLWNYQYKYFKSIGNNMVAIDKIQKLCTTLNADDVDFLLEKELLSEQDFNSVTSEKPDISILYLIKKIIKALPNLPLVANTTKTLAEIGSIKKILDDMPREYETDAVRDWCTRYESI